MRYGADTKMSGRAHVTHAQRQLIMPPISQMSGHKKQSLYIVITLAWYSCVPKINSINEPIKV